VSDPVLLYGVTGYTGGLILEEMLRLGMRPVLAGRSEAGVTKFAAPHGLEVRVAALDDAAALDRALSGMKAVMHCAGPFSLMGPPMVDAALRNRVHYLDITGEIAVFERCAALNDRARAAGVGLVPGVGFDVVPSDCLAAHLKSRLPSATSLTLAFTGGVGLSHGTATTMVINIGQGGAVRRGGHITRVPLAWHTRDVAFSDRVCHCVTIPWGDVSTAWYSTRIPDITVYTAAPRRAVRILRLLRPFVGLISSRPGQALAKRLIDNRGAGPSAEARQHARARLWGEAKDASGAVVQSRLDGPDGYTMTAKTAAAAVRKVLVVGLAAGFHTPAMAFGKDFILEIAETSREDVVLP
jgi:short subunit dehydrogenase-like uncharacterized protein